MKIKTSGCVILLAIWLSAGVAVAETPVPVDMPFDSSNPFIFDNDGAYDSFSQEFAMALAHNGTMRLLGISGEPCQGTDVSKVPCDATKAKYGVQDVVYFARQSGLINIPDATVDPRDAGNPLNSYDRSVARPASGSIDDTQPVISERARMIMNQVIENGTPSKPVILAGGGPLTTFASAYLMAKNYVNPVTGQIEDRRADFASKSIVSTILGGQDGGPITILFFNGSIDQWAAYVILQRMRMVIIDHPYNSPVVWDYLNTLPDRAHGVDNRLKEYINEKKLPTNWVYEEEFQRTGNGYWHSDADPGPMLIALLPEGGNFFRKTTRVSFDYWAPWPPTTGKEYLRNGSYDMELKLKEDNSSDDLYVSGFQHNVGYDKWTSEMTAAFSGAAEEPELLGWWKFDETSGNATDSSGNENTGAISGNPVWEPSGGKIGGSLKLDASGDSVFVGNGVRPTTAFTIAYWTYPIALAPDAGIYADFDWGTSFKGILLDHNASLNGSINLRTGSGQNSVTKVFTPAGTIVPGQWIHIAVTWKNNVTKFYKNGSLLTTSGATNSGSTIGYANSPGLRLASDINAKMDDFRVYNYVLSAAEIQALANVPSKVPAAPSGLRLLQTD